VRVKALGLKALVFFLEAADDVARLDAVVGGPELAAAHAGVQSVQSSSETLSVVNEAAEVVSAAEARDRLEALAPRLSVWFERLSAHDALRGAGIAVKTGRAGGVSRNKYQIRATGPRGWQVAAGPMLSGGYQTALAVAALCALGDDEASRTSLGLLALDEPTHSLDAEMAARMGRALGTSARLPRLVLTTTDESFADAVADGAGAARVRLLRFAPWTASAGTRLLEEPK